MFERLNQYQIMWVFVHFDLPTDTKKDKKNYRDFRQTLLKDGFAMIQYSIYARHCSSRENAEVHKKRIKNRLPPNGDIIIFEITYSFMESFRIKNKQKKVCQKSNSSKPFNLSAFIKPFFFS